MIFVIQQALMLMLTMYVHQQRGKPPQIGKRHDYAANPANIPSFGGNLALDAQKAAVSLNLLLSEHLERLGARGNVHKRLDARFFASRANQPSVRTSPQNKIDTVHNDGLTSAGFTAEHIHALMKINLQVFNQRDIAHGH